MLEAIEIAQQHIAKWSDKIREIQESCLHPNKVTVHKGDTGNYDPSQDCYWTENKCPDCGKFWTSDHKQARS